MTQDPAPAPATSIRRLLREVPRVALGTLLPTGEPYVSLAMVAVDHDLGPLLLLSDLAEHTANLARDPRLSLLFDGTVGMATPLAGARASLQGRAARTSDARLLTRYLARHPDAAAYAGFRDFALYRVAVERAHLVAGFGRIHWVEAAALQARLPAAPALAADEADIVRHMNEDHADAVALYATRLLGRPPGPWRMTGLDPEGVDLRSGGATARLWFDRPVGDAAQARGELVRLVKRARATQAESPKGGDDRG